MSSPYPLRDNLPWLFHYLSPSLKNPTDLATAPLSATLTADAGPCERIAFFGDLMCMQGDRIPLVDPAVHAIVDRAALVVGNLESPLLFDECRPYARYRAHFAMASEFLTGLLDRLGARRDRTVLTIANNHMADQGEDGLNETLARLADLGIAAIGRYAEPASAIRTLNVGPLRVGLLGWTHWLNAKDRFKSSPGVLRKTHVQAFDFRPEKQRQGLHTLIGSPHWEWEFRHFPRAESRALARNLFNAGFDAVIGHHPHVLQPIEADGGALVAYSLGNLNGPALKRVGWPVRLGAILELELATSGPALGRVARYELHPLAQLGPWDGECRIARMEDAPEPERARLSTRLGQVFKRT